MLLYAGCSEHVGSATHSGGRLAVETRGGVKSTNTSNSSVWQQGGRHRQGLESWCEGMLTPWALGWRWAAEVQPGKAAELQAERAMQTAPTARLPFSLRPHLLDHAGAVSGPQCEAVPPFLQPGVVLGAGAGAPLAGALRRILAGGAGVALRRVQLPEAAGDVGQAGDGIAGLKGDGDGGLIGGGGEAAGQGGWVGGDSVSWRVSPSWRHSSIGTSQPHNRQTGNCSTHLMAVKVGGELSTVKLAAVGWPLLPTGSTAYTAGWWAACVHRLMRSIQPQAARETGGNAHEHTQVKHSSAAPANQ